jgi:hypothetical protein
MSNINPPKRSNFDSEIDFADACKQYDDAQEMKQVQAKEEPFYCINGETNGIHNRCKNQCTSCWKDDTKTSENIRKAAI